jgi:hypothetical protein
MNTPKKSGRSKRAKATKQLTPVELFFYDNAGYSYSQDEAPEAGRIRCAKSLAKAEQYAQNLGWEYEWQNDNDADLSWLAEGETVETCEGCILRGEADVLESLWGITDASDNYRRVVEAELALEALHTYDRETETLDAH